ncbi:hypothetical protein LSM04_001320 [Trypanosoma melophagium]|uniref:uncharacterized protein n=1 Tax=Trypanosoma melophagium TaxID=715481 RepID=UPI00351A8983|nr:hypothetical protein LSM04_001320 [Trypanosoma melophagium]
MSKTTITRRIIVVKVLFLTILFLVVHAPLSHSIHGNTSNISIVDNNSLKHLQTTSSTSTTSITESKTFSSTLSSSLSISDGSTYTASSSLTNTPSILVSSTRTLPYSPTISITISHTPSLEEIPDNMYTRAESCGIETVNRCAEQFCNCITNVPRDPHTSFWNSRNGIYQCDEEANRNCYYIQYCARERVSCIWNASFEYQKDQFRWEASRISLNSMNTVFNNPEAGVCHGLKHVYGNFSQLSPDVSYYDSQFYSECVDYVTYLLGRTYGLLCIPKVVPMYACGPSLFPVAPTRLSNYTSIPKGSRRLVISIRARIVGNFSAIFNDSETTEGKWNHENWLNKLNRGMYTSFRDAIGVDGEFAMSYAAECITVYYNVGVGDADPWVGDLVTANALRLMLRNVSWMNQAQVVVSAARCTSNLTVPIVVYGVKFEASTGQFEEKLCNGSCVAGLTVAAVLAFVVFFISTTLCLRRPQRRYSMFDIAYDSEEEMDNTIERQPMKQ